MLSFTSSLSPNSDAFVIFVTEKLIFNDRNNIIPDSINRKINLFLKTSRSKNGEEINSLDISDKQKCFIIKIKNIYKNYYPEEVGGTFFFLFKKI